MNKRINISGQSHEVSNDELNVNSKFAIYRGTNSGICRLIGEGESIREAVREAFPDGPDFDTVWDAVAVKAGWTRSENEDGEEVFTSPKGETMDYSEAQNQIEGSLSDEDLYYYCASGIEYELVDWRPLLALEEACNDLTVEDDYSVAVSGEGDDLGDYLTDAENCNEIMHKFQGLVWPHGFEDRKQEVLEAIRAL